MGNTHPSSLEQYKGQIVQLIPVLTPGPRVIEIRRLTDHSWGIGVWNITRACIDKLSNRQWYQIIYCSTYFGPVIFFIEEHNEPKFQLKNIQVSDFPDPYESLASLLRDLIEIEENVLTMGTKGDGSTKVSQFHDPDDFDWVMTRNIYRYAIDLYSINIWLRTSERLYSVGLEVQQQILNGLESGWNSIQRVVNCIIENRAHLMSYGNFRYQFLKIFGLVLPIPEFLGWLVRQFKDCRRVISVGSGTCFLEIALQMSFIRAGYSIQVICVENGNEELGIRSNPESKFGFQYPQIIYTRELPEFEDDDGIFISWGRPNVQASKSFWGFTRGTVRGNIWQETEDKVNSSKTAVNTVVVIGDISLRPCTWPVDRWCGCTTTAVIQNNSMQLQEGTDESQKQKWIGLFSNDLHAWDEPVDLVRFKDITDYSVCWKRQK